MAIRPKKTICKKRICIKKNRGPSLENIPNELISEVLCRVASSSIADLYRAKASCKALSSIGEEGYVLKHATLQDIPIIPWPKQGVVSYNKKVASFLQLCRRHGNLEALFRQGVIDYFSGRKLDLAFESLKKAANSGHRDASYVVGLILIFCGDKKQGIQMLGEMKGKLRDCRMRLKGILTSMWVTNAQILNDRPKCCSLKHPQSKKSGWLSLEDEDEDDHIECEACFCDNQIASICQILPHPSASY